MKLLTKQEIKNKIAKENEQLVERNIRLREIEKKALERINSSKEDYGEDKLKALRDFEAFTKDLQIKKDRLLKELNSLEKEIESKKDIYYGLVAKQDELDEKSFELFNREKKLELRESFIKMVEEKQSQFTRK